MGRRAGGIDQLSGGLGGRGGWAANGGAFGAAAAAEEEVEEDLLGFTPRTADVLRASKREAAALETLHGLFPALPQGSSAPSSSGSAGTSTWPLASSSTGGCSTDRNRASLRTWGVKSEYVVTAHRYYVVQVSCLPHGL